MVTVNRAGEILFERIHGAGVDGECEDEDEQQLHGETLAQDGREVKNDDDRCWAWVSWSP